MTWMAKLPARRGLTAQQREAAAILSRTQDLALAKLEAVRAKIPLKRFDEWCGDVQVLAEAERLMHEQSPLLRMRIRKALEHIAFADLGEMFRATRNGRLVVKPFDELTPGQRALIQSLKITPGAWGKTTDIKLLDRMAALNLLAKIEGLTQEGANISIRNGVQVNQNTEPVTEIKVTYVEGTPDLMVEEGLYADGEPPRLVPTKDQADSETPPLDMDIDNAKARSRR